MKDRENKEKKLAKIKAIEDKKNKKENSVKFKEEIKVHKWK